MRLGTYSYFCLMFKQRAKYRESNSSELDSKILEYFEQPSLQLDGNAFFLSWRLIPIISSSIVVLFLVQPVVAELISLILYPLVDVASRGYASAVYSRR